MTDYTWGPCREGAGTRFRLWAPAAQDVLVELADAEPIVMKRTHDGWWEALSTASAGTRYRFRIGGLSVPDPASRRQSGDIHGWSVVEDDTYAWRTQNWSVRKWEEAILYELHAGLLGGFRGVATKLDELAALGITAIELMPINDFPGRRNWGYDGVLPYAPDEAYGTPDDLKFLIDEAHARGLMILLDVVYNHFGPDGNYLGLYAPQFFRSDRKTPWGDAIDFRQPAVQAFFIENALYWLKEFRFDGLRFDAVHAIGDSVFMQKMGRAILAEFPDRHLILENEDNDAPLLDIYRAQWNDDFHNTLHFLLTGEDAGYYADFAPDCVKKLSRLLREGFAFQGEYAEHIDRERGTASAHLPMPSFVSFLQNHDQIGNRALGERLIKLCDERALKAAAALQFLCPQIPMLFMGEEQGTREPFLFFTDHQDPKLAEAVRKGRAAEFAKFPEFASGKVKVPDPNAPETFEECRLGAGDPKWRAFYKELIDLRGQHIIPRLAGTLGLSSQALGGRAVMASWRMGDDARLTIAMNLSSAPVATQAPASVPFFGALQDGAVPAFSTVAWMETP